MRRKQSRKVKQNKARICKMKSRLFAKAKCCQNAERKSMLNKEQMNMRECFENPNSSCRKLKSELDKDDVISAMALFLNNSIQNYEKFKPRRYGVSCFPGPRIFNSMEKEIQPPSISEIQVFIQKIFDKRRLHLESGVVALVLLMRTGIKMNSLNWMRLILVALLLANKEAEDVYSVWNAKFVGMIPNLEILEINILELEFLQLIKYRLHVESHTYLQYYNKLQYLTPEPIEESLVLESSEQSITEIEGSETSNTDVFYSDNIEKSNGLCDVTSQWQELNIAPEDSIA
jgi:hypothetical protein